jgi:hypothetical protein
MKEIINYIISEKKKMIFAKNNYTCQKCGQPAIFLAHRISKSRMNIEKYGKEIIHAENNLVPVCEKQKCNDSFNIGFNQGKIEKLLKIIFENLPCEEVLDAIEHDQIEN